MANKYRLTLNKLKFCSLVDEPAQPNAKTLLFKRAPNGDEITATASFVKSVDELGLAFFWAFTSTNPDGSEHFDLQGDTIDQDFVKAAMEFMLDGGGAVDEMHDEQATEGRVVFAFPMTPDIAKAFGVTTKQTGLMIAIKPTADQLAKLKDGTYSGVSIGGLGTRELIKSKRAGKVEKAALYTDEVEGHAHKICVYEDGSMWVDSATMAGAEYSHSHGIVRGEDGALTILADSGHTHALAGGQPSVVVVDRDAIVVVAARASSCKSTTATAVSTVSNVNANSSEQNTMKTDAEKLADLQKRHDRLAGMSGVHKTLFDTLKGDDAEAFLAKSDAERDAAIEAAEKANPVVYTSKSNGQVFRAKDHLQLIAMAKQLDQQAETIAKGEQEIEKAAFEKRASADLSHFSKGLDARTLIVRAILKSGADQKLIDEAFESLKGANAALKILEKGAGVGGDGVPAGNTEGMDPFDALTKGLETFAKANKLPAATLWTEGLAAFTATEEGAALKAAYDESVA